MLFQSIVEPILIGFESDEDAGGAPMPGDQDLLLSGEAEIFRKIIFNRGQGDVPDPAILLVQATPALRPC
jgi:hypothetical protein